MGQRLVITVDKDGEDICKIYYHWSAYTLSALYAVRDLIPVLEKEGDTVLNITRFLESQGGGLDMGTAGEEYQAFKERYPNEEFSNDVSRNDGLIAITEKGMEDMQGWSEGDINIDLDTGMVHNEVIWGCGSDYLEEWEKEMGKKPKVKELTCNIFEFSFDDIGKVIHEVENGENMVSYNGEIYQLIQ